MTEDHKNWLLYLQDKGIKFETVSVNGKIWHIGTWEFKNDRKDYRIPAQSIPDIPNWRELCREMQSRGVRFKMLWGSMWNEDMHDFEKERDRYRIPQQPLPEWREEMTEETKPDPIEEIQHREMQIQWHEDMLVQLRGGEKPNLHNWEYRIKEPGLKTLDLDLCPNMWHSMGCRYDWNKDFEYRRKPRKKVKVWDWFVEWPNGDTNKMCGETEQYARNGVKIAQKIDGTEREVEYD